MDDATLAVVGSIAAALLGGIVGASVQGVFDRRIERDREKRDIALREGELKAAARLVFTDLEIARLALEGALDLNKYLAAYEIPTAAWRTHGVSLSAALPADDYDAVAEACAKVATFAGHKLPARYPGLVPEIELPEGDNMRDGFEKLLQLCLQARTVLHPLAYGTALADDS